MFQPEYQFEAFGRTFRYVLAFHKAFVTADFLRQAREMDMISSLPTPTAFAGYMDAEMGAGYFRELAAKMNNPKERSHREYYTYCYEQGPMDHFILFFTEDGFRCNGYGAAEDYERNRKESDSSARQDGHFGVSIYRQIA